MIDAIYMRYVDEIKMSIKIANRDLEISYQYSLSFADRVSWRTPSPC